MGTTCTSGPIAGVFAVVTHFLLVSNSQQLLGVNFPVQAVPRNRVRNGNVKEVLAPS